MIDFAALLEQVKEIDVQLLKVRENISSLKKSLMSEESDLISLLLIKEKTLEQIKTYKEEHFHPEVTERDIDIERFRKILPELLKKV